MTDAELCELEAPIQTRLRDDPGIPCHPAHPWAWPGIGTGCGGGARPRPSLPERRRAVPLGADARHREADRHCVAAPNRQASVQTDALGHLRKRVGRRVAAECVDSRCRLNVPYPIRAASGRASTRSEEWVDNRCPFIDGKRAGRRHERGVAIQRLVRHPSATHLRCHIWARRPVYSYEFPPQGRVRRS